MKTTPVMGRVESARRWSSCATISQAASERVRPSRPVAQKAQSMAQPACEERQATWWVSKSGMRTASTRTPSGQASRYLRKPSAASTRSSSRSAPGVARASTRSITSRRTLRASRSDCPRPTTAPRMRRASVSVIPARVGEGAAVLAGEVEHARRYIRFRPCASPCSPCCSRPPAARCPRPTTGRRRPRPRRRPGHRPRHRRRRPADQPAGPGPGAVPARPATGRSSGAGPGR